MTDDHRNSTFSFGFTAEFVFTASRKYALQHASVMVFHDIVGEAVPFFRAEWDQLAAADKSSTHAQPHWHFVQSPERIGGIVRTLMAASGEPSDFSPTKPDDLFLGVADYSKFHFAMTSMWEKNETPPYKKRLFDSGDFPKWFESLTSYIAGQINYLVSHMSPDAAPHALTFVPAEAELLR